MALDRMLQIVFFLSITYTIAFASPAKECGSVAGKFTKVSLSGCPDSVKECELKRGTNATLDVFFTTNTIDHNVTAVVYGVLGNVPIPVDIPNPDACTKPGLTCPLQPGQRLYHYSTTFSVNKSYPKISLDLICELHNEHNDKIICAMLPVSLT